MEYRSLGRTGLQVGVIGLGTMTFGEQNTEAEGHAQIDCALDHGVNLIDTSEMYAVPPRAETYGATERIIGTWIRRSGKRDRIVLCSKVAGPGRALGVTHVRGGDNKLGPARLTNFFGRLGYEHAESDDATPLEETLEVLGELVRAGKVRHVGVSNETPWGLHRYLHIAHERGLPRVASIQNPYSLLNRSFEVGLAEMAIKEDVGLLAYSPLGFGVLTGKFLNGARPPSARLVRWSRFARYSGALAEPATAAYVEIARRHGLEPAQMALAFVNRQRFVASTLIGATTMAQLETNLASVEVRLSDDVVREIEAVHRAHPNPCP